MTDKPGHPNRTERLRALTGQAYASSAVSARGLAGESARALPAGLPEPLAAWLGRLALLHGVPFNYLVPDAAMLPPESIRFFFVDPDWIDSLVDGAFSIGKGSSRDDVHHEAMLPAIRSATAASARTLRSKLRGRAVTETEAKGDPALMTGFLLRSALVSGWPRLEVKAFDGNDELGSLRIERLSPDVLIALFEGVPTSIEITEPPETLHFGLDDGMIPLRWLDDRDGHQPGHQVAGQDGKFVSVTPVMRKDASNDDSRVLNVVETRKLLETALQSAGQTLREYGTPPTRLLSPADFAMQMMSAPGQWVFEKTG